MQWSLPKQSTQKELLSLKNRFLKSVNDYLNDCIAHMDIERMKRFIASVRDILKRETLGQE